MVLGIFTSEIKKRRLNKSEKLSKISREDSINEESSNTAEESE